MIEGDRLPDATAFSIHLGVYRHRKDVHSVMHTHPKYSTTPAALKVKYKIIFTEIDYSFTKVRMEISL